MRLCDVGDLQKSLPVDGLGSDPIWAKTGETLTAMDITMFYARAGLKDQRQAAIDLIDLAQGAVIMALFAGELPKGAFAHLVLHETPPDPFLSDEFIDGLIKLRPSRRAACIYMLENHLSATAVTELTWSALNLKELSPVSLDTVNAARAMRHIMLPYVFWEWATPTIASPLLELGPTVEAAFGCDAAALQERYDRMILIDRRADAASLVELAKQLGG